MWCGSFWSFQPWYVQISLICKQGHLDVELNENGRQQAAVVSCAFCILSFLYTIQDSDLTLQFLFSFTLHFYLCPCDPNFCKFYN